MSKATFDAVMAEAEAPYYNAVLVDTWGHLFPLGLYYEGYVRIANSIYSSGNGIIDEKIAIDGSPWWFDVITEFALEMQKDMTEGSVAEFKIAVTIQHGKDEMPEYWTDEDEAEEPWAEQAPIFQRINISMQHKKILINSF